AGFDPGAIGIDILMPEADPLSADRAIAQSQADVTLRAQVAALPTNDAVLAAALASSPTVLAMVGTDATTNPLRVVPMPVRGVRDAADLARARARLLEYDGALSSLASLTAAARGWGLISAEDTRGILRHVPLVANVGGTLVPGLAVEMWRVAARVKSLRVSVSDGVVSGVAIGPKQLPAQADGSARPWFSLHREARFVSAVDVLNGKVAAEALHRSFVLVGVTGLALGDYVWTPVGKIPGVEVHAQVLENMNDNAFLWRPKFAPIVEAIAFLVIAMLAILFVPRFPIRYGALLAAACVMVLAGIALAAFRMERLLLDAATPAVAFALLFATLLGLQLADATRHRKALQQVLQREREAAARVAGELQAARRVQLDTLPRPETLRDDRIEIDATMEPARDVGGDLYDFFRLDDDRSFFMIGDVSGKGLSASMFMAVSKALCKSTMLRARDADLGALLSQVNVEVGRDNASSFFVTVFAGILDLQTGVLDYCNAGHENPWRRESNGTLTRLREGGGPPLCVVDDFEYRAARVTLARGDLVCAVSDGVTEARNASNALYGAARVEALLESVTSAGAAVDAIRDDVHRFTGGAEPFDDMTVLAVAWRGPSSRGAWPVPGETTAPIASWFRIPSIPTCRVR
ncbi:MAG TPA: SpoIIE family protein phosphatase, partial [Casimicrobiaceae bacterium]|nr:SpoIIE family protein phosphatase [Casimicrobiaceae bacterium]